MCVCKRACVFLFFGIPSLPSSC
uniref:Uncharacterized protein n=1 Tax=Anopheles arabiensis TaxID=7173 RepID=A0A182IGV2_ANOAR